MSFPENSTQTQIEAEVNRYADVLDIQEIRHHDQATIQPVSLCGNDGFELAPTGDRLHNRSDTR
jgi:hypothetical protein